MYQPGETVDLTTGGILFRGSLTQCQRTPEEIAAMEAGGSPRSGSSPDHVAGAYLSVNRKQKNLKNLGASVKMLVGSNKQFTEGEFGGLQYIRPKDSERKYIAKPLDGSNYVIILHFDELLAPKIRDAQ